MDPAALLALAGLVSAPRLSAYSAAFWGVVHVLEVAVRNAIHAQMCNRYGRADWWDDRAINRHLAAGHATVVRVAGYIDPDCATYIDSHSRVPEVLARKARAVDHGYATRFSPHSDLASHRSAVLPRGLSRSPNASRKRIG